MKKGFTMIELIFVIVILGVLAAVAIPKLNATREDAEIAKAATNITTLLGDFGSYYTAHGDFPADHKTRLVTNVPLTDAGVMNVQNKACLTFALGTAKGKENDLTITAAAEADMSGACKKVLDMPSVKSALTSTYVCGDPSTDKTTGCTKKDDVISQTIAAGQSITIKFGASSVKFD